MLRRGSSDAKGTRHGSRTPLGNDERCLRHVNDEVAGSGTQLGSAPQQNTACGSVPRRSRGYTTPRALPDMISCAETREETVLLPAFPGTGIRRGTSRATHTETALRIRATGGASKYGKPPKAGSRVYQRPRGQYRVPSLNAKRGAGPPATAWTQRNPTPAWPASIMSRTMFFWCQRRCAGSDPENADRRGRLYAATTCMQQATEPPVLVAAFGVMPCGRAAQRS